MLTSSRVARRGIFPVLALSLACAAPESTPSPEPDRAADESTIRGMVATHESQVNARDFAGFASVFAEDGDVIVNNSPKATGPQAIQAAFEGAWSSMPAEQRITLQVDRIRFLGNDVAVVDNVGTYAMGDVKADRATAVLERTDGTWKIVALRIYPGQM